MKKNRNGNYSLRGYFGFKAMAELHEKLFPGEPRIDGNSRRAHMIYRALDRAYTYGIKDALQMDDAEARKLRRTLGLTERPNA